MLPLAEALQRILATLPPPDPERVSLAKAAGRFLLAEVRALVDLPPFDNSAMDGYAVRAADVPAATANTPVPLRVIGKVPAGTNFTGEVRAGECVRLFTGSPLPPGADAVVMQEDTRTEADQSDRVSVFDAVRPGESVRQRGEDVATGTIIARAGDELTPGRIALLCATGVGDATVGCQPTVGLLATGTELREVSAASALLPGQIYESNRAMLAPMIARAGGIPKVYPLVPDSLAATRASLEAAFAECEVVITSGGVSVGEMDFVKAAFEQLGGRLEFWKVAMRPGKPFVFGRLQNKFLFGLPGNPVSAFVTFLLLVRPALRRWQGAMEIELRAHPGLLGEGLTNTGDRCHFVRVRTTAEGKVYSAGRQASHALGSLANADGLLELRVGENLTAGDRVNVLRWD